MKLKKGDKIQIIAGKDKIKKNKKGDKTSKGNQGKVLTVLRDKDKVVVEGLNLRFKHIKPRKEGEKGQRIEFPAPIETSNVMLVCPKCSKLTRVEYKMLDSDVKGKKKVRICKKCKEAIE